MKRDQSRRVEAKKTMVNVIAFGFVVTAVFVVVDSRSCQALSGGWAA